MDKTTAKSVWGTIGHLQTAYGLWQVAVAFTVSGFVGWFGGVSALKFMFYATIMAGFTAVLYQVIASRMIASIIVVVISSGALALAYSNYTAEYENYILELNTPAIGYIPYDLNKSMVVAAAIKPDVANGNNFPIWIKIKRLTTSIDRKLAEKGKDGQEGQIVVLERNDGTKLSGGAVIFDEPMAKGQSKFATIEFEACYGRTKDKLNKSIGIKSDLTIVWLAGDIPGLLMHNRAVQNFDCD